MQEYAYIPEMLTLIDEPNRSACQKILQDNEKPFKVAKGSQHNHQNWTGGYWDHIREIMNIGIVLYRNMNPLRTLPFSLSDVLLVLFLHDLEKPWKEGLTLVGVFVGDTDVHDYLKWEEFKFDKFKEYGITLTSEQENAIRFIHGEGLCYSSSFRVMGPLGAFCHSCDVFSARIWFDYPKEGFQDSWWPATRVNSIK